jgi:uncharacterized membrane protein
MRNMTIFKRISTFLITCLFIVGLLGSADAATMQRRKNPEAGKKKAAKRIGIGTAIGAGAGALIGGKKGALIGAGAGAGAGTAYHYHRKSKAKKRYRRY